MTKKILLSSWEWLWEKPLIWFYEAGQRRKWPKYISTTLLVLWATSRNMMTGTSLLSNAVPFNPREISLLMSCNLGRVDTASTYLKQGLTWKQCRLPNWCNASCVDSCKSDDSQDLCAHQAMQPQQVSTCSTTSTWCTFCAPLETSNRSAWRWSKNSRTANDKLW